MEAVVRFFKEMRRALPATVRCNRFHSHLLQESRVSVQPQRRRALSAAALSPLLQESRDSVQPQLSPFSARRPSSGKAFCSVLEQHVEKLRDVDTGHYFDPPFWDSTYATDPLPLEWYQSYSELFPLLTKYIPKHSRVLVPGCGNSELSEDMVKDGYNEVVNIDISAVVIEAMKKKYQNVPQLKYMTMDVLDLSYFNSGSFDSVIDKGTLDAIMCIAGGPYNVAMMLAEITRVLRPGGVYMLVSFASPRLGFQLLNKDAFGWKVKPYIISKQGSVAGSQNPYSEPVLLDLDGTQKDNVTLESSDSLYIYMCTKLWRL